MNLLDISEVSKQTGMPASAIRHYEDKGLITSLGRRGLKRLFAPDVLDQLALIALGQAGGFSLDEIKSMFGPDGRPALPRDALHARATELDRQIEELAGLRDMIRHVADCPAPNHMDCKKFRRLMRISGKRRKVNSGRSPLPARAL
ncbi:MAG: helix-turn-helix domain-containing protein [Roseibium sp.]